MWMLHFTTLLTDSKVETTWKAFKVSIIINVYLWHTCYYAKSDNIATTTALGQSCRQWIVDNSPCHMFRIYSISNILKFPRWNICCQIFFFLSLSGWMGRCLQTLQNVFPGRLMVMVCLYVRGAREIENARPVKSAASYWAGQSCRSWGSPG